MRLEHLMTQHVPLPRNCDLLVVVCSLDTFLASPHLGASLAAGAMIQNLNPIFGEDNLDFTAYRGPFGEKLIESLLS